MFCHYDYIQYSLKKINPYRQNCTAAFTGLYTLAWYSGTFCELLDKYSQFDFEQHYCLWKSTQTYLLEVYKFWPVETNQCFSSSLTGIQGTGFTMKQPIILQQNSFNIWHIWQPCYSVVLANLDYYDLEFFLGCSFYKLKTVTKW